MTLRRTDDLEAPNGFGYLPLAMLIGVGSGKADVVGYDHHCRGHAESSSRRSLLNAVFSRRVAAEPRQTLLWRLEMREECPAGSGQ
jgi:hypothetical protein